MKASARLAAEKRGRQAERIAAWLVLVLAAVAADPSVPVSRVSLLDGAGRRQVVAGWTASDNM